MSRIVARTPEETRLKPMEVARDQSYEAMGRSVQSIYPNTPAGELAAQDNPLALQTDTG